MKGLKLGAHVHFLLRERARERDRAIVFRIWLSSCVVKDTNGRRTKFLEVSIAMTAKDQITKMLDQLMGQNRDGKSAISR